MRELFNQLEKKTLEDKLDYLIDTCFFIWIFEHQKDKQFEKFIEENECAITSFNAEELVYIEHKINHYAKDRLRKFLHNTKLKLLEVPANPGNADSEHLFVKSVLPELDTIEHDPSDSVILAAAIKVGANVLTRDKHDIFNTRLENFLQEYKIKVFNKLE
ncbi:MAG: PIN domain-containing protein [Nanoarchaeota archaeon]|nr:PIN domain-containing protein [Nanoarchaeota archaeon]MBU1030146.1 PIN domain-containing protein [Nanoarchaeota archaeon]MBU1850422.1 PIN domain-containing protein [Nanoarchaeota archaeon]